MALADKVMWWEKRRQIDESLKVGSTYVLYYVYRSAPTSPLLQHKVIGAVKLSQYNEC